MVARTHSQQEHYSTPHVTWRETYKRVKMRIEIELFCVIVIYFAGENLAGF